MEELYLNNIKIELKKSSISRTFQINDLAELKDRQSNYSNSIKIPLTKNNIKAFELLGITGNTTNIPYDNMTVKYVVDGIELINGGKAIVKKTDNGYNVTIYDGNIDLKNTIGQKQLKTLDWSSYNHTLTINSYLANNNKTSGYIYSFASFFGKVIDNSLDTTPPTVPTSVTVGTITAYTIDLSWTSSTDAVGVDGYNIYVDGVLNKSVSTTSTTISGLLSNTAYTFTVSAFDVANNESSQSTGVNGTTLASADTTPPTIPNNLTIDSKTDTTMSISWDASTDTESGVAGYKIYKDTVFLTTVSSGLTYTATGLTASTSYTFTVSAIDNDGNESSQSTGVTDTTNAPPDTTPPTIPTNLTEVYTLKSSSKMSWDASTDTESGVAGYKIYKDGTYLATTTNLNYIATGLTSTTNYDFNVTSFDDAGNESSFSNTISVTTI